MTESLPLAEELAVVFARMSGLLMSPEAASGALSLITSSAVETVPGASSAGVTLVDEHGDRTTAAATDPAAERADALQYELDEGPCLSAVATRTTVRLDDVSEDRRWPRWSAAASALGLGSALSAPLVAGDRVLGAIKVYSEHPWAFDAHAERVMSLFAAQAAVLVAGAASAERAQRLSDDLRAALRTRDVISQARGLLMAREHVDEHAAMALLSATAQREGRSLHSAAKALVDSAARRRR